MALVQFQLSSYDYEALRELPEKELRREYSRLRDVAHKRIQRLEANPTYAKSMTALRYRNAFPQLSTIRKGQISKLSKKLSDLKTFLSLETSTVSGAKNVSKRIIEGLRARGYTQIRTEKDLRLFGRYMDFNRALKKGGKYDSEKVIEMMDATDKAGISAKQVEEDFSFWMKNYDGISEVVPEIKGAKKGSKLWVRILKEFLS